MITFYPGPSKVYPQVAGYMQEAFTTGVLSINHRSEAAMELVKEIYRLLPLKLGVPEDYATFFVSSATESWEIVSQSLVREQSFHLHNGAFGEKWLDYARRLRPLSLGQSFDFNAPLPTDPIPSATEVLCLTHNETSNGTQVAAPLLADLRSDRYLTAVDVTSSLGGALLDFAQADVWFASVQKCLGLPAGLGLLICSPRALRRAEEVGERKHYNSLLYLHENALKYQTQHTPNVLGMYLLMRVLQQVEPIATVAARLRQQATDWYALFDGPHAPLRPLAANPAVRSDTVLALTGPPDYLRGLKTQAAQLGITLGNGYGSWKDTTIRLANFPAIEAREIAALKQFLVLNHY